MRLPRHIDVVNGTVLADGRSARHLVAPAPEVVYVDGKAESDDTAVICGRKCTAKAII